MKNIKDVLIEIHKRQMETFCSLEKFRGKGNQVYLSSKSRGLYWIWTNLSDMQLKKIKTDRDTKQVPISELVSQRCGLKNINKIVHNGFRIVYNGIGGYKKQPSSSYGLRGRILQEFNCNDKRTGTLNLSGRDGIIFKEKNWAVSYFDCDDDDNSEIITGLTYPNHAKMLEMNWRIEYGIPILTRH